MDIRIRPDTAPLLCNELKQRSPFQFKKSVATVEHLFSEVWNTSAHQGIDRLPSVLSLLWKVISLSIPENCEEEQEQYEDPRIRKAEEFMLSRLDSSLSVEEVAEAVGLSRCHLSRLFSEFRSTAPANRLREFRLEKAVRLLEGTTLTVQEVADVCGFACSNHFSRVFKQSHGKAPLAFRKEQR